MTKMNRSYVGGLFLSSVLVTGIVFCESAIAEKTKQKKGKSNIDQVSKKKTLGELLKQEDRGAKLKMAEKKATSLPSSKQDTLHLSKSSVNLKAVKPPKTQSFFGDENDDKVKLEKITDEQIQELYKLTQRFKNSKQRGELWLRLAELYVEKAGLVDFRNQGVYDEKLQAFQSGASKVKPVLDNSQALEYNQKAIQLYEWFLRDFPKDEKVDQALFFLGYNFIELNQVEKGIKFYTQLTKEHPDSPYVVDAHFALAEYHFDNEKWNDAKQFYLKVTKNKRHRLYSFSKYKYAWTLFRTGDSQAALKTMEDLVRASSAVDEGDGKKVNRSKLGNEALRDTVLFYSEIGNAEKAPAYFAQLAGDRSKDYLERLAYFYGDKGNIEGTRFLFKYLIQQDSLSSKAFDYQFQIVKVFSSAKKSREFRDELFSWVRTYNKTSSWGQAHASNKELTENSYKLRETTLRNYILEQHQTAQNSRASFSQNLAAEGYRVYLSEFTDSTLIADMHFYFGELLYDMNQFEESAAQYRWVMENGKNSKFFLKASENTLLTIEKTVPSEDKIIKYVGETNQPVALEPKAAAFVEIAKSFLSLAAKTDKSAEIRFRIGRLLYLHNQFDDASVYFREIMKNHPKTKYAEYSANLLLDSFNIRKDYAGLEKAGNEILALPTLSNSKAAAEVRGVLEKASFKKAQDFEAAKDFAKAALNFEAFALQNLNSNLAAAALFNAAINYEKANNNSKAVEMHQSVVSSKRPEAQQFRNNSQRILAKLYQDSGQLEIAARAFADLAQANPKDPLAQNYIFNSAILFDAVGNKIKAEQSYEKYLQGIKGKERQEILFLIAKLQKERGAFSKAIVSFDQFLNLGGGTVEQNLEATNEIFELSFRINRRTEAEKWKAKLIAYQAKVSPQGKGAGAEYVAKFKLAEVERKMNSMKAISIPLDPRKQQGAIKQKIDLINQLNSDLAAVIKYDSAEEIVGALAVVGEANHHMYQSLMAVPLPKGLTVEEQSLYKKGVEQIALPFLNKSRESYKAALERASQLEAYGRFYQRAREEAAKVDTALSYDSEESIFRTRSSQWIGL